LGFNPAGLGDEADARKSKRKYDPVSADRNHPFAHVVPILRDGVTFLRTRASLFALFVCVQVVCVQSRQFHVHVHEFDFDASVAPAAVWFEQTLLGGCSSSLGTNTTTFTSTIRFNSCPPDHRDLADRVLVGDLVIPGPVLR
jgi:hypothetical protein